MAENEQGNVDERDEREAEAASPEGGAEAASPEGGADAASPEGGAEAASPEAAQPAAREAAAPPQAESAPDEVVEGDEVVTDEDLEEVVEERPREKPAIPGMDLEVDIVREGEEALRGDISQWSEDVAEEEAVEAPELEEELVRPIADAAIDLASGARYSATGKRKTAVARVILKPGTGVYSINGRSLEIFFPRATLQRNIRQPLEAVGYQDRMDVVASMHGGGVSAQAGALRHGISRALIDADPNLRSELKRRGFLTRDARVKERKKAGLKKARKRPQFSKR
jgi:small subunit ribosomal protein S9